MVKKTRKVLLVEDNPGDSNYVINQLKKCHICNYDVVNVDTLNGALEKMSNDYFDVILLDLSLPDSTEDLETVSKINPFGSSRITLTEE